MLPSISIYRWQADKILVHTESKTLLNARISASRLSFLDWSWAKDNPSVWMPFVTGPDVGPEGTVGACKFSIVNGSPMSKVQERRDIDKVMPSALCPGCGRTRWFGGVIKLGDAYQAVIVFLATPPTTSTHKTSNPERMLISANHDGIMDLCIRVLYLFICTLCATGYMALPCHKRYISFRS